MDSDREFLQRFEAASIPREEWDHAGHLRMAFLYLRAHGFPEATRRLRLGIQSLNRAHGTLDARDGGYHETLTLTWARLVEHARLRTGPSASFDDFIVRNPELMARDRVLEHYSQERLRSPQARREFVLPDRAPLPAIPLSGSAPKRTVPHPSGSPSRHVS